MIARGVPSPHHPQWGCFEKDQAEALARLGHKVVVMSIDAASRGIAVRWGCTTSPVMVWNTITRPYFRLY